MICDSKSSFYSLRNNIIGETLPSFTRVERAVYYCIKNIFSKCLENISPIINVIVDEHIFVII